MRCNHARADLIELPLLKEDLEDKHKGFHGRQRVHQIPYKTGSNRPVGHIKADIEVDVALDLNELDDGHLCFGYYLLAEANFALPQGCQGQVTQSLMCSLFLQN